LETGIELMCQEEGLGPGATETSWLYDLAVAPLIEQVQQAISDEDTQGIISTIIDDISIATTFDKMVEALNILVEKGKEVGYFINFDKTQYLMSPVDNHNELKRRMNMLLELGFKEDMIKIHPDSVSFDDKPIVLQERKVEYGVKLLGAFLGDSEYIKKNLYKKISTLNKEKHNLIKYPHVKNRYLLTKFCFIAKFNYIFRTQYPWHTEHLLPAFDELQGDIALSLFNEDIDHYDENITNFVGEATKLSTRFGSLGLREQQFTIFSAYFFYNYMCL
jgi:hypothetical protein